jgi:hypothetical protein
VDDTTKGLSMLARVLAALAAALVLPAAAFAKGPLEAAVSGPGLDAAVVVRGGGEGGTGTPLGRLVESAGFFPLAFGQQPDPTTRARPKGDLGPAYTVRFTVPGPDGENSTLIQTMYPYAKPPVSYMAPAQRFFGGQRTHGGWLLAADGLRPVLAELGLPASAPTAGGDDGLLGIDPAALAVAAAAAIGLALAAAAALFVARRPRPV